MKDRIPKDPGRVLITPENDSTPFYATMTRADNPEQEGTPLNKNSLLKDTTAALFGLGTDALPDDVLALLPSKIGTADINKLAFEKITESVEWIAPKVAGQMFKVFAVGGGGGGGSSAGTSNGGGGGGSGHITIKWVEIPENSKVSVICGAGGTSNTNGGETKFGEYVTAPGGSAGGKSVVNGAGGVGGYGGAGGGAGGSNMQDSKGTKGGNGSFGGGGGGSCGRASQSAGGYGAGGDGGPYGGGGGGGGGTVEVTQSKPGANGEYSGKKFTDPIINVLLNMELIGDSVPGTGSIRGVGGAGYGGAGGGQRGNVKGGGGGGGYCGNGGNGGVAASGSASSHAGGGGGGGYCGNGGNGNSGAGGGGGGFFSNGGDGGGLAYGGGGGGGFFSNGGASTDSVGGTGGNGGVYLIFFKED